MADLQTLFAYEKAIETAWQQVLASQGFNAYMAATDQTKITPYVDIILDKSSVYPNKERGQRYVTSDGKQYFSMWHGHLVSTVYTNRGTNSDQNTAIVGTVRSLAVPDSFDPLLEFHQVALLEDVGTTRGIDTTRLLDWSQITYLITFGIRPNAWP